MLQRSTIKNLLLVTLLLTTLASCKKAIELDPPPTLLTNNKVFASDANVTSAVAAIYARLFTIDGNFLAQTGTYTDELNYHSTNTQVLEFVSGQLSTTNTYVYNTWSEWFSTVYKANALLEGLASATTLSEAVRIRTEGEAKFLRAYSYFYLVNTFGAVPLVTTTDVRQTSGAARTEPPALYAQIIQDAKDAQRLLQESYAGEEKVRATKWAATALLARVYLNTDKWAEAAAEATAVITSGQFELLPALKDVFLKNSKEAIWQLWNQNGYSSLSSSFYPTSGKPAYSLSNRLYKLFDSADQRKNYWITPRTVSGTTYQLVSKYKATANSMSNAEYTMYLRLAELLLVRAEAYTQQNQLPEALTDLNKVRTRAGLQLLTLPLSKEDLLDSIYTERSRELFAEGGHRFFDLKRSGTIDQTLGPLKPAWKSHAQLFPVPQRDRNTNPNLTQNPGY